MTEARDLADLVHALQGARTPLKRLRILALAWRTVRSLTPFERERIATELGFDGARQVVDRLAEHEGGVTPALLMEAIGRAEKADPNDVRAVLRALRDPDQRKNVLKRGLETLETYLVTGSWQATTPADAERAPIEAGAAASHDTLVPAAAVAGPSPGSAPAPPAAATTPPPTVGEESPLRPATGAGVVVRAALTQSLRPAPAVAAGAGSVAPVAASAQGPKSAATDEAAVSIGRAPVQPDETSAMGGGATQAAAAPSARRVLAGLRDLRGRLAELGGADRTTLMRVLESFPAGWARRRALVAMLEQGVPADVDDALALIESLATPGARRWCLRSLLRSPAFPEQRREEVEERAGRSRYRLRRTTGADLTA